MYLVSNAPGNVLLFVDTDNPPPADFEYDVLADVELVEDASNWPDGADAPGCIIGGSDEGKRFRVFLTHDACAQANFNLTDASGYQIVRSWPEAARELAERLRLYGERPT